MKSGMAKGERVPLGSVVQIERCIVEPSGITLVDHCVSLEDLDADSGIVRMNASRDLPKSSKFRFSPNHVLYGKLRPYLRKVVRPDISGVCSTDILPILPGSRLDRDYLFHFLRTPEFTAKATAASVGVNLPRLSPTTLSTFDISLPPLPEQRRIAEVLDRAEALRDKRHVALARLDSLTQSFFLDLFGDPSTNPKGWPCKPLGSLASKFSDGPFGSNLKTEHYTETGVRVVRLQNIGVGEFLDDDKAYISECHFTTLKKHECRPGDVLIGTLGDPNLRACIQPEWLPVALNKADCVQCRPDERVANTAYICALLNQRSTERMAHDLMYGQTRVRISMGRLRGLEVPIPPIDLQHEFARQVGAVEKLKVAQRTSLAELDALFASLQSRAFKGEL